MLLYHAVFSSHQKERTEKSVYCDLKMEKTCDYLKDGRIEMLHPALLSVSLSLCWAKVHFCLWAVRLWGLEVGVAGAVSVRAGCTAGGYRGLMRLRDFRADCHVWLVDDLDVAGYMRSRRMEKNPLFSFSCTVCSERVCCRIPVQDLFKINFDKNHVPKIVINAVSL